MQDEQQPQQTDQPDTFNLDYQWKEYLRLMKLDPLAMPRIQYVETRKAFYAGMGSMLVLFTKSLPDLPEEEAQLKIKDLLAKSGQFWMREIMNIRQ